MHLDTHTGLDSPKGIWWKPAHKAEKVWVDHRLRLVHGALRDDAAVALEGRTEPVRDPAPHDASGVRRGSGSSSRSIRADRIAACPIVAPPPGADVYLAAVQFQWLPILGCRRASSTPCICRRST